MILTCPACQTRYEVDAAKFPPQGRNVRCAKCGETWHQAKLDAGLEDLFEPSATSESPAPPPSEPEPSYHVEEPAAQNYVAPTESSFVRDEEPQADVRPAPPAPSRRSTGLLRKVLLGLGWATIPAAVILIGIAASAYRQQIVHAWPQSASLYSKLGMKVTATGLDIRNVKYSEAPQDGQIVLTITGTLKNVSEREQPVPQIRIGLVDTEKRELYHWTFAPDVMTIRPGQSHTFVTRVSNPPDATRDAVVGFAKAGE